MRDLAFQEATQHNTKPSAPKTMKNEWKQTKTGSLVTQSHWIGERVSERKEYVFFTLQDVGEVWHFWIVIVVHV